MTEGGIMLVNINNDESKVAGISQKSAGKVSAVQSISGTKNRQQAGNNLPGNTATAESNFEQKALDAQTMERAVQLINKNEQVIQREIRFSVDEDSGKTVIKVMDLSSKEVIRQMPNEEALIFARKLTEGADLKLFNEYT